MQQNCSKCHAPVDADDVFCRKCGASLAFDTTVIETIGQEVDRPAPDVRTGEIITVGPENNRDLTRTGARALYNLSRKAASKVSDALKTEQGRKLAQGATALAVAIGVELANQAAGKLVKGAQNNQQAKNNQLATRQPTNMADAFLKAIEDQFNRPAPTDDKPDVEETIIKERIYIKRVWRKPQS
jgi:hypothetical protein